MAEAYIQMVSTFGMSLGWTSWMIVLVRPYTYFGLDWRSSMIPWMLLSSSASMGACPCLLLSSRVSSYHCGFAISLLLGSVFVVCTGGWMIFVLWMMRSVGACLALYECWPSNRRACSYWRLLFLGLVLYFLLLILLCCVHCFDAYSTSCICFLVDAV